MKIKVLMDNISSGELAGEWGLSILIEYEGKKILLDTGASGAFAENAEKMGIDLAEVDFAVLSHAHYDHSDGMEAFFAVNDHAPLYIRKACQENCYSDDDGVMKYVGIHEGWLEKYRDRLVRVDGEYSPCPGVKLLPHSLDMKEAGLKARMYVKELDTFFPELFQHEQSLVFEVEDGLVIFNSCCHGGVENIIEEVRAAYGGRKIIGIVGGFHLYKTSAEDVRRLAGRLQESGVEFIVTGHCTGDEAFGILHEVLGEKVRQMYAGLNFSLSS